MAHGLSTVLDAAEQLFRSAPRVRFMIVGDGAELDSIRRGRQGGTQGLIISSLLILALALLADHFEHALRVVGPRHVGIGSDFDGTFALPAGMEDCSKLTRLTAELIRRGHDQADLVDVLD